ncbi:hypothetical protein P3X46_002702 [Hevea brasiliensis]|uniref:non-specific serine/threonine protein kinase n=1 Tax=Hevea brasiliensis TaxID=3981 RepID=A0ABQ9N3T1_HEVBR|nr:hypothetical protein P3X46_002702 [Hevea brasiliensis]
MSRAILLNLHIFFLFIFLWSLLCTFLLSKATETDIDCLISIEVSLEDPLGKLTSWDFSNNTEGSICGFIGIDCWRPNENRVFNIRLSGMGLRGQFPRDVGKCTSLTGLDLSNNELQGPIPFDIAERLPYVTSLDLSFNNLSGEIPSSIANCTFLIVLKLNNNRLTGSIPMEIGLLSRLTTFSVANNLLSGPLPTFRDASFTRESFANNSGLCGRPLEPCRRHRWKFDSLKKGFTIGYAISFVLIIVAFIPYDIPPWLKFKTKNKMLKMRRNISQVTELATVDNLPEGGTEILKLEKVVPRLPYRDLSNATNNFSEKNIIGLGKMGILFKATLSSGGFLAVKKLHYAQFLDERFTAELKMLGIMRHINLLPLLGFCINSKERLLVYKYMPNGSLYDWLKLMEDQAKVLEWPLRVKIATGLARGLAWLHQGCNIHIIHLNISSKCVLLDYDFEPKLSNFGEAILLIPKTVLVQILKFGKWNLSRRMSIALELCFLS